MNANGEYPKYSFGDDVRKLNSHDWKWLNSKYRTHAVATKKPNGYGLYDVHGNVEQWVQDAYGNQYGLTDKQLQGVTRDPHGAQSGKRRVTRGGAWNLMDPRHFRSAYRHGDFSDGRSSWLGFRLVRIAR